jgi:hypothetical protein
VLALVVLARVDAGDPARGPGDGQPDLEQPLAVRPLAHLRPHQRDPGVATGRTEQVLQGVGVELHVVVQQPDPMFDTVLETGVDPRLPRALSASRPVLTQMCESAGHRGTEAQPALGADHGVRSERLVQHLRGLVAAAGVHRDQPVRQPDLALQRAQQPRQPASTVVSDDDGRDEWATPRQVGSGAHAKGQPRLVGNLGFGTA